MQVWPRRVIKPGLNELLRTRLKPLNGQLDFMLIPLTILPYVAGEVLKSGSLKKIVLDWGNLGLIDQSQGWGCPVGNQEQ